MTLCASLLVFHSEFRQQTVAAQGSPALPSPVQPRLRAVCMEYLVTAVALVDKPQGEDRGFLPRTVQLPQVQKQTGLGLFKKSGF